MPALPTAWASAALLLEQLLRSPAARRELRDARMQFMAAGLREAFDRRCRHRWKVMEACGTKFQILIAQTHELKLFDALNRRARVLWQLRFGGRS